MSRSYFNTIDNLSLQDIESDADLIPLMTTEDEEALENEALPKAVPILPLINMYIGCMFVLYIRADVRFLMIFVLAFLIIELLFFT